MLNFDSRRITLSGFVLIISIILLNVEVRGQVATTMTNVNAYGFPSPDNLGIRNQASNAPQVGVNLFTGTASVSIPICELSGRKLTVPISLNYVGGKGIKLQDYAGSVGQGWQLSAGGSITRVVRGYPDEISTYGYRGGGWGNLIASNWAGTYGIGNGYTGNLTPTQVTQLKGINSDGSFTTPLADGEPDLYFISTPSFTFQFVLDGNGNPVTPNNTGISISFSGNKFIITDDQGNKYYFGSTVYSIETATSKFYGTNYTYNSTWYLDKIVAFNSADVINFAYTSNTGTENLYHYQYSKIINTYLDSTKDASASITYINQAKYISNITSTLGSVTFNYSYTRSDLAGACVLNTIVVNALDPASMQNISLVKTFTFNTSYFGSPSTDINILRLKLDNITVTGNTDATSQPFTLETFKYNTNTLPSRQSNSFDYWGYYSAAPPIDPTFKVALSRPPNLINTQANVLQSISDEIGGKWTFNFELNDYYNGTSNVQVGGLRVHSLSHSTSLLDSNYTVYNYSDASGHSTGAISDASYQYLAIPFMYSTIVFSESPTLTYDVNGIFVGYSTVKSISQNGGYKVSTFNNFNTPNCGDALSQTFMTPPTYAPMMTSLTSRSFKRGLLLNEKTYNSAGALIQQINNTYSSQTSNQSGYGYRSLNIYAVVNGTGGGTAGRCLYYTSIENYQLAKVETYSYDQKTPANYLLKTTNYSYSTSMLRVQSISTPDSKLQTYNRTFYYPENNGSIPTVTSPSPEYTTLSSMTNSNVLDPVIYITDSKNGTARQQHNFYSTVPYGTGNNIYLSSEAVYNLGLLQDKINYNYDLSTSNLINSVTLGGKSEAFQFGYNSSYPVAKVSNASSTSSYTLQNGTMSSYFNFGSSVAFSMTTAGSITFSISFGSYPGATNYTTANYSLTGTVNQSGYVCYAMGGSGYTCSYPTSVTINLPIGNYVLGASGTTNFPSSNPNISYSYSYQYPITTYTNEFFYNNFEEEPSGTSGTAHTGNRYMNSNYIPPFTPPNSRSYVIQYWTLASGLWTFHEQPYTQGMTLTGPVDDVRIYPIDGGMTSWTYQPLIGKTSQIEPSGNTQTYEYDGLARINTVRDQNKNIIKKYDYQYGYAKNATINGSSTLSTSFLITYSDVSSGKTYFQTMVYGSRLLGNVPAGTYNITISPATYSSSNPILYNINGSTQVYYAAVLFGNVTLSGAATISVSYPPAVAVLVSNTGGKNCTLSFKNLSTLTVYTFTSTQSATSLNLGTVPAGTYNVTMTPTMSNPIGYIYQLNQYSQINTSTVTFTNVSLTTNCAVSIALNLQ